MASSEAPDATGKRELNKAQNRKAILAAALEVFVELGYGAATVRDIIRRTNLAAGTFYNYFPDKESVFLALINEHLRQLDARLHEARKDAKDPDSFFSASYRAMFEHLALNRSTFDLLRRNAGTLRSLLGQSVMGSNIQSAVEDIREATRRGILPNVDAEYLASAMAGVAFEVALRMVEREPIDVDYAAAFATAIFVGTVKELEARQLRPLTP